MGILDTIRNKADELDKTYNPLRKVADSMDAGNPAPAPAAPPAASTEAKTPQQLQYEAKEKAMNANNPYYVPRAKGGCVKAGGEPIKVMQVGESVKTEPMKVKGNP